MLRNLERESFPQVFRRLPGAVARGFFTKIRHRAPRARSQTKQPWYHGCFAKQLWYHSCSPPTTGRHQQIRPVVGGAAEVGAARRKLARALSASGHAPSQCDRSRSLSVRQVTLPLSAAVPKTAESPSQRQRPQTVESPGPPPLYPQQIPASPLPGVRKNARVPRGAGPRPARVVVVYSPNGSGLDSSLRGL